MSVAEDLQPQPPPEKFGNEGDTRQTPPHQTVGVAKPALPHMLIWLAQPHAARLAQPHAARQHLDPIRSRLT